MIKESVKAVMWRLSSEDSDYRWSYYSYLVSGPTAEDAMRSVVARIRANNIREVKRGYEPDPVPQVMWAVPFVMPKIVHMSSERYEIGEDFEGMFDYEQIVEVRL